MAHQWGPLEESVVAQEDDGVGQKKRKAKDIGNGNENVDGVSPWLLCCPPYPAVLASMYDMGSRGACGCTSFIMINNEGRSPSFFPNISSLVHLRVSKVYCWGWPICRDGLARLCLMQGYREPSFRSRDLTGWFAHCSQGMIIRVCVCTMIC
jgi:hypothetical protein